MALSPLGQGGARGCGLPRGGAPCRPGAGHVADAARPGDVGRRRLLPPCQRQRTAARSRPIRAQAAAQALPGLSVAVEKAAANTRRLYASVQIAAPLRVVWQALTSYEDLDTFIPGLALNQCLQRRPGGARLLQVGEQNIALGAKFKATVILDIQEFDAGVPPSLCLPAGGSARAGGGDGGGEALFPLPQAQAGAGPPQDIAFSMVSSREFQAFRGIWRMQDGGGGGGGGGGGTLLSYALTVRPQPWLPVALIQSRIEGEVKANLTAVKAYSERQHSQQQQARPPQR